MSVLTNLAPASPGAKILNLTFHGIGEPSRWLEPGEDAVWVSKDKFRQILDLVQENPCVILTFDDGNTTDLEVALPELVSRNLKGVFFVVAARIGKKDFLGEQGLLELVSAGMEVGSHGMAHRPWRALGAVELAQEIRVARELIEQRVGQRVTQAACPYGSYDRRSLAALRRAGFERVYTSDRGWADHSDWFQVRNTIRSTTSIEEIVRLVRNQVGPSGFRHRVKLAVKRWR